MKKTISFSDLILFAYNELDQTKTEEIKKAIISNEQIRAQVDELIKTKSFLDNSHASPSRNIITNILNYSKSFEVFTINNTDFLTLGKN